MKKTDYLAPLAETVEFSFQEKVLAASDENFNTENLGTTPGIW